ncbi:hypothetical protein [Dactylosporangium sp. NPDC049140]|uniref:hypothetical protein n=1 Tax=Dactylosporangium sp. NPDC049140 TaxID=3155647 RepID=UPI003404EF22
MTARRPAAAAVATVTVSFIARGFPEGATPWATSVCTPAARERGTVTGLLKFPLPSVTTVPSVIVAVEKAANPLPITTMS